jgi:hypothetical protein
MADLAPSYDLRQEYTPASSLSQGGNSSAKRISVLPSGVFTAPALCGTPESARPPHKRRNLVMRIGRTVTVCLVMLSCSAICGWAQDYKELSSAEWAKTMYDFEREYAEKSRGPADEFKKWLSEPLPEIRKYAY